MQTKMRFTVLKFGNLALEKFLKNLNEVIQSRGSPLLFQTNYPKLKKCRRRNMKSKMMK